MNAQTHDDMNDKWLNELRDRMADYRESAPENLWDDIARELERDAAPIAPRRNVVALWIRRSAVAAMLVLALTLGYDRLSRTDMPDPAADSHIAPTAVLADALPLSAAPSVATADTPPTARKAQPARPERATERTAPVETAAPRVEKRSAEEPLPDRTPTPTESLAQTRAEEPKEDSKEEPTPRRRTDGSSERRPTAKKALLADAAPTASGRAKAKAKVSDKGRLTADIYMSGLGGSSDSQRSFNGAMMISADMYRHIAERADPPADPLTVVMLYNRNSPIDTEIKHRQPLRFGFSLRYMITPAFGIESGISYTLLMSNVNSGGEECYYDEDRTLHYMGVPVNLVWNAWSGKRLSFYLSGGASVEKCVSGHAATRYVLRGRPVSSERRDISVAPLQWSVAAAAGLQYDLSPRTGLYIEPGVGYYFDNGSETETAYSRRPLNFNLNMGIRISFR